MSDVSEYITTRTFLLNTQPEEVKDPPGYQMYNSGGVEVEVAEFLYSLVRMLKPATILETGTHLGISSVYFARGCQVNNKGKVITYEIIPELLNNAKKLWGHVGVESFIDAHLIPSLNAQLPANTKIDILFLDSEPQYRFDEFTKFWPMVAPGGVIIIHDLHKSMGHHGQTYHGVYDWPYGDWRPKLGSYLKERKLQVFHFGTPRGLTVFQKVDPSAETHKYMVEG